MNRTEVIAVALIFAGLALAAWHTWKISEELKTFAKCERVVVIQQRGDRQFISFECKREVTP